MVVRSGNRGHPSRVALRMLINVTAPVRWNGCLFLFVCILLSLRELRPFLGKDAKIRWGRRASSRSRLI